MNRLISIDIAKAICIILVVIGHYNPDNAPEWYHTINLFIYTFHMPLFMFASGYVYAATIGNLRGGEFLYKKFKRLMIPYFSTSIIIISIKLLTQQRMLVENPVTYLLFQDVLPAGSRFFPLVYLGALADFFARRRGKIKSRTSRIVRNKFVRYISAHRMARNILHKFRHTNAEIFYAGHNPQ